MTDHVTLSQPVQAGERTISEVTIRRPKVKDLRALEHLRAPGAGEIDQGVAMAAMLCDLPVEAVDEMDATDFAAISEIIAGFFSRATA